MMAEVLKVLAQISPVAATLTDGYTVPGATQTVLSSIWICNQSAVATSFRIAIAVAGAANNAKQYLAYDTPISGLDVVLAVSGLTLAATDVVRVYNTLATLSFNMFGSENS